jgi:hypothetical protein
VIHPIEDDIILSVIRDHSKRVAAQLPAIAKIPPKNREKFCTAVASLIADTCVSVMSRDMARHLENKHPGAAKAFAEIEGATFALLSALRGLTGRQFEHLQACLNRTHREFFPDDPNVPNWAMVVPTMLYACSSIVNKNPTRGNRKGSVQDWMFQRFVRHLWLCAAEHGGNLSANCKNNVGSGAMFKALDELRPRSKFFIKSVLPAQTIANIVKLARSSAHP